MSKPQAIALGLPGDVPPYVSSPAVHNAKLNVLSFDFNLRSLETNVYSLTTLESAGLLHGLDTVLPSPQRELWFPKADAMTICQGLVEQLEARQKAAQQAKASANRSMRSRGAQTQPADQQVKVVDQSRRVKNTTKGKARRKRQAGGDETEYEKDISDKASIDTTTQSSTVSGIPDMVWLHSYHVNMRLPPKAKPESDADKKIVEKLHGPPRCISRYQLYKGRLLRHQPVVLIEEDKKHANRRVQRDTAQYAEHVKDRLNRLHEAADDIGYYLFIYFYLINPQVQRVVARTVSGTYWQWRQISRDEIPIHYMPNPNADLNVVPSEKPKFKVYFAAWEAQPIFESGTRESDEALTAMRKQVLDNIVEFSDAYGGTESDDDL
ncbi:hypothetical protein BD626DRAFT_277279 [Schizophyllum amplum]|uniref:Uncharacterized protein n=1 Tax=Schizophyllum amplum TaxID=97359 RepID=A0A550BTE4_9AGAR|nr:hypothetical protein BD626DRAFT_277279 [Auriculariopsis ampla]